MITYPPIEMDSPANILRPFCAILTFSSRGVSGEGVTCMIVESSTKRYPTIWKESLDILHLNTTPWPASRRQSRRGELKMDRIYGAAPLPLPKPYGVGSSYLFTTYVAFCLATALYMSAGC